MTIAPTTRTVAGTQYPAPGRWTIDPGHAEVGFVGRHFGLTKIRGRFTGVTGHADIAEDLGDSTLMVTIDMATVDSGDDTRDDHLRSVDLFSVETHPQATRLSRALPGAREPHQHRGTSPAEHNTHTTTPSSPRPSAGRDFS